LLVAGTVDLIADMADGGRAIVDLKTGEPQKTNRLQTAAYYEMAKKFKPTRRIIVYCKKNLKVEEFKNQELDYKLFLNAYNLYIHLIKER
jgi:RecB family exonuclease